MSGRAAGILVALIVTAGLAGCREQPDTPTTTETSYRVEWPVTRGKELYRHYCTSCHGADGLGDGYNSEAMGVAPRNLTDRARMAAMDDAALARLITGGGPAAGLGAMMPAFGATLEERELKYVIAFLRAISGQGDEESAAGHSDASSPEQGRD